MCEDFCGENSLKTFFDSRINFRSSDLASRTRLEYDITFLFVWSKTFFLVWNMISHFCSCGVQRFFLFEFYLDISSVMLMLLPFSIPPFLYKTTSGHNQVRKIGPKNILSVLEVFKSNNNWLAATYFWSSVHSRNLEVGVQDLIFAFVFKHIVGNSDSTRWSNQVRRLKWNENNLWHGNVSPQSETNSDEFRHLKSCNPCF